VFILERDYRSGKRAGKGDGGKSEGWMQDSMLLHLKRHSELVVLVKCAMKANCAYIFIDGQITAGWK